MTHTSKLIVDQASKLSQAERAEIAQALLSTLNTNQPYAWLAEAAERLAGYRHGRDAARVIDEVIAKSGRG